MLGSKRVDAIIGEGGRKGVKGTCYLLWQRRGFRER